jgi:hypothetical protein
MQMLRAGTLKKKEGEEDEKRALAQTGTTHASQQQE